MMKKIVLINQSSSYLMIDIVNAYADKYEDVVLITGKITEYERKLYKNVKIDKIIAYNRKSIVKRIFTWSIAFIQILFKLLFKYRKYDVVYVTNPPISYLSSLIVNNPFSVIIFDTYPDALRNIGIRKGHMLYDIWCKWNIKLFAKAKNIYTISNGMAEQLSEYVDRNHIKIINLWCSSENFKPIEKDQNPFIIQHNLQDKFIVMYSGNMGYTHNVDTLVEVAKQMQNTTNVHFLFIGDGKKKNELVQDVNKNNLKNCTFLDWQPSNILPYSLAAADIGVVTLNDETALTSVPSKTFNLMAVGSPLLCITTEQSEIAKIVRKNKNGIVCSSKDINKIITFIQKISEDKYMQNELSNNSLEASKQFTYKNAEQYVQKLL